MSAKAADWASGLLAPDDAAQVKAFGLPLDLLRPLQAAGELKDAIAERADNRQPENVLHDGERPIEPKAGDHDNPGYLRPFPLVPALNVRSPRPRAFGSPPGPRRPVGAHPPEQSDGGCPQRGRTSPRWRQQTEYSRGKQAGLGRSAVDLAVDPAGRILDGVDVHVEVALLDRGHLR
jgi:hypothetical protein